MSISAVKDMTPPAAQSLNDQERLLLLKLIAALEEFRRLRATMPLHHVLAMLHVAVVEGQSVSDYALELDLPHSSMSRHLLDIGSLRREGRPGLGLVALGFAPEDRRTHIATLTPKGVKVARAVIRWLFVR
jgi:DNA-binding MarR family transcriptional regulator